MLNSKYQAQTNVVNLNLNGSCASGLTDDQELYSSDRTEHYHSFMSQTIINKLFKYYYKVFTPDEMISVLGQVDLCVGAEMRGRG